MAGPLEQAHACGKSARLKVTKLDLYTPPLLKIMAKFQQICDPPIYSTTTQFYFKGKTGEPEHYYIHLSLLF
jgi:hypothetical protein